MVVSGMLALFAFGQALPRLPLRLLDLGATVEQATPPAAVADPLIQDETSSAEKQHAPAPTTTRGPVDWRAVAASAYAVIALAFLAQFVTGMFLVRKLFATAHPIFVEGANGNDVYESERIAVPFTVGWARPRILLPANWREWERGKLDAVLAHEGAHARRRDGLVAALAGLNRSILWFHPLAWILQRKLAFLAEQACDESCVAELGDRERYAHLLLEMASVVDRSHGRLRYHAMTMATGSHLQQRIDALLQDGRRFSRGLTRRGWAALMLCGIPVVLGAAVVELDRQPPLRLQMPRRVAPASSLPEALPPLIAAQARPTPPKPATAVQLAQAQTLPPPPMIPQASTPKWDSVSIKPCAAGDGAGRAGRGGGKGRGIPLSPAGELFVNCLNLWELINHAVSTGPEPLLNDSGELEPFDNQRIRGGPSWMCSDYYTIDAKSSDLAVAGSADPNSPAARKILNGPMLQALLEDRFQLKIHRGVEQVPMFSLVVANSGFKLLPMEPGGCIPHEPGTPLRVANMFPPGQKPLCITHTGWEGPNWTIDAAGQRLANLAGALGGIVTDRPVLDKTKIAGLFSFHLVFAHDQDAPGRFPPGLPSPFSPSGTSAAPTLPMVLEQQLGLALVPDTGPREYIVIDSATRPLEK
jgi:uncharacterized protein (TIGR03435 family)